MKKRDDLLDLNDALQHPGRHITVDVETELPEEPDIDLVQPLNGFLDCVSTGNVLLVDGEFTTKCVMECARCAAPLEIPVEYELSEQFPVEGTPSSMSSQDYARVVPDEPFPLFDGNALMVENLLRQGLLLAMPNQPLCEHGWDGDCPRARARQVDGAPTIRPELVKLTGLIPTPLDEGPA